ncbi:MAG: hypothetical protein ABIH92_03770 [Nanoarchaeota archaeon]
MKKAGVVLLLVAFGLIISAGYASAAACDLDVSMINQDPYPAVPGDYVKVVFQITGLENPDCAEVSFELVEEFPFSLDPGKESTVEILGGTYIRNYESFLLVPYDLRVDEDALDGDNTIEAILRFEKGDGRVVSQIEQFDINVEGINIDFEISVKDFDSTTNTLTFEILNVGENDVEALTMEILKQDNIVVKGPNRNIVGDLDANEDSTAKFEALPYGGEVEVRILYTDSLYERRTMTKSVVYDSSYFTNRKADEVQPRSTYFYLFWGLAILWILLWIRRRWKRKKERERERKRRK